MNAFVIISIPPNLLVIVINIKVMIIIINLTSECKPLNFIPTKHLIIKRICDQLTQLERTKLIAQIYHVLVYYNTKYHYVYHVKLVLTLFMSTKILSSRTILRGGNSLLFSDSLKKPSTLATTMWESW